MPKNTYKIIIKTISCCYILKLRFHMPIMRNAACESDCLCDIAVVYATLQYPYVLETPLTF